MQIAEHRNDAAVLEGLDSRRRAAHGVGKQTAEPPPEQLNTTNQVKTKKLHARS